MGFHEISFRVRYSETDQMGVVHHGSYAPYLEMGRVEWLRNLGVSYKSMEESGIMLPVISLRIDFKRPARYDDLLRLRTELVDLPSVKIHFTYTIHKEDDELLATAATTLAFIEKSTNRPIKCPAYLFAKIDAFEARS